MSLVALPSAMAVTLSDSPVVLESLRWWTSSGGGPHQVVSHVIDTFQDAVDSLSKGACGRSQEGYCPT